jgi:hypothetical protein
MGEVSDVLIDPRFVYGGLFLLAAYGLLRLGRTHWKRIFPRVAGWFEYPKLWVVDLVGVAGMVVWSIGLHQANHPLWPLVLGMAVTCAIVSALLSRERSSS